MRNSIGWLCVSALASACVPEAGDSDRLGESASSLLVDRVGILGVGVCEHMTVSAAIAAAPANATILVEQGFTFTEQLGTINKDLIIRSGTPGCTAISAPNAVKPIIDAAQVSRLARITADVTFQQIELRNGLSVTPSQTGPGGNLWISSGTTRLIDAVVMGGQITPPVNDVTIYGAGIHVDGTGSLWVEGASVVWGNHNTGWGAGGIYVAPGTTAMIQDHSQIGFAFLGANTATGGPGGVLASGTVTISDDAEVTGNEGLSAGGIQAYDGGEIWLLDRAQIRANRAEQAGGIFIANGSLFAEGDVEIINNRATVSDGGGIVLQDGTLSLDGALVAENDAEQCGGGIYAGDSDDQDIILLDTTIHDNYAGDCGGGLSLLRGTLEADDSTFSNNRAGTDGGGLFLSGTEVDADVDRSFITGNTASRGAGMVVINGTELSTSLDTIADNVASSEGGGVWIGGATATWVDGGSTISDNTAVRGGGLFAPGGTIELVDARLERNYASAQGGAGHVGGATALMRWGFATDNIAGTRGGGFVVSAGLLKLFGVNVATNTAGNDGGGAVIENTGRMEAVDVWFRDNAAGARGGGIAVLSAAHSTDPQLVVIGARNVEGCVHRGTIQVNEYCSEVRANTSVTGGGGIYLEDGTTFITGTAIRLNTAPTSGSAVLMRSVSTGTPAVAVSNTLILKNGNVANVDSVRVMGGSFVGEHITSTENLGTPFRFGAAAGPSLLQRSIVWDLDTVVVSSVTPLGGTCSMFRLAPTVPNTIIGVNIDYGLDPIFHTTARGNYRLGPLSIDAVDQCDAGLAVDLDTDPRAIPNGLFDRGAFERQ